MVINLGTQSSILNQFMAELRDSNIQKDSLRFRRNMERIGEIFAYEISKQLEYKQTEVQTPLGVAQVPQLAAQPVIASVLRAGLPFHQGFLNVLDKAENAFISACRKYEKDGCTFHISFDHIAGPSTDGKTLILVDPMQASGASMVLAYQALLKKGTPVHTHIVSVISSREGLDYLQRNVAGQPVTIWTGAIDDELTAKSYIVPGLGDAGDLCYGEKE
ncbi:MAG: uracil phosphoribosyltransferase [Salinivirgaceae bacterium]|nr:uracil phosphoribosyltransferase [Salinivirgaceae bacterium]